MTKTFGVIFLLSCLGLSAWAQEDMTKTEHDLEEKVAKACGLAMKFDLHDYEYGRDESSRYSNLDFEDAAYLTSEMSKACELNPKNKRILERVRTVFIKRASLGERKLLQKKNGDLVYLAGRVVSERGKSRDDLIAEDLFRVLKLTKENFALQKASEQKAAEKAVEKKQDDDRAKKQAELQVKIQELTAWFQGEVKKAQTLPPEKIGPRMEALSTQFQEKMNALTRSP